jgi:hypothetical protein
MSIESKLRKWKYVSIGVIAILAVGFSFLQVFAAALFVVTSFQSMTAEAAPAGSTTHVSFKGKAVEANWYSEEDEVYTEAALFATESAYKQKSDKYGESVAYIIINQYKEGEEICEIVDEEEYCWTESIPILAFDGYTTLAPEAFIVSGATLRSASLNTQMTGYDYASDSEKTITINAVWSGLDGLFSGNSNYRFRSDDYRYSAHFHGSNRAADASAAISGDINMILDSPPLNEEYASLYFAKQGYVESIRFD